MARVMSEAPETASPAAKRYGTSLWRVLGSTSMPRLPATPHLAREVCRVGKQPDGRDHDVTGNDALAARNRLGAAASRGVRLAEPHHRAAETAHFVARSFEHLDRGQQEAELDTFFLGVFDLGGVGGHLLATAAVGNLDLPRPESSGRPGGVHGHIAASDDHDALSCQFGRQAESDIAQEVKTTEDALQLGARHLETCRNRSSGRHQDGVVTLRPESLEVLHPRAGGDLDTESRDIADVLVDDLFGQAINRVLPGGGTRRALAPPPGSSRGTRARASCQAAVSPAGPDPTMATLLPFGSGTVMPGPSISR